MICLVKYKDVPVTTAEHVAKQLRRGVEVIVVPDGITLEVHDYYRQTPADLSVVRAACKQIVEDWQRP